MNTHLVTLAEGRQVDVVLDHYGSGQPFLLLHGGAGPQSVLGLAQQLATTNYGHAYVPTHPGFVATQRPDWLTSIPMLAEIYLTLIEQLDLKEVIVVGSSIGGWIAAEMAVRGSARIRGFVLIDAVGIVVDGHPVADIFPLSMEDLARLSYHNPAAFRIDPAALSEAQRTAMAANRKALAIYGGQPSMTDPTLLNRLRVIRTPTLVLWGDSDGIATPDYGRVYAAAIPAARFQLLSDTGHLPQIETPDQVLTALRGFVDSLNK